MLIKEFLFKYEIDDKTKPPIIVKAESNVEAVEIFFKHLSACYIKSSLNTFNLRVIEMLYLSTLERLAIF